MLKLPLKLEILPLLAFLVPLTVRAIPEILVGPYIVGFDTLGYYVPNVLTWLREGVGIWNFMAVAPLFYLILMMSTSLGISVVVSLKVLPLILLGFLGLSVYFYAKKAFSWSPKKSLLVALVGTLYFVALRVSWDMLRNELGLIFLFVTLIFLQKNGGKLKEYLFLSFAMILVVLAHPLVSVIMFVIIAVMILRLSLGRESTQVLRLLMSSIPAVVLFLMVIYANQVVSSSFSFVSGFPGEESGSFMALFGFASYSSMVVNSLGFLAFCYLPLLPLVLLGIRHFAGNLQMKVWVFWILIALSSSLISPNAFIPGFPYRWTLMLTYPLAFYAVEAIANLRSNIYRVSVGLMLATLTLGFVALPNRAPLPYYTLYPYYVPTSMLQNTVSSGDFQDTNNAFQWLGGNMHDGSRLLTHDVFYGWSLLTLNRSQVIPIGYGSPEKMAEETVRNDSIHYLYLIWWTNGSGWYGQPTVSSAFEEVYESGKIAVYIYKPSLFHDFSDSECLRSLRF